MTYNVFSGTLNPTHCHCHCDLSRPISTVYVLTMQFTGKGRAISQLHQRVCL